MPADTQNDRNESQEPNESNESKLATAKRPVSLNGGPLFSEHVPDNGYLWFYIDALSDDGNAGFTIIAFVGCVFSPFYAKARREAGRRHQTVDPMQHCAINIALYHGLNQGQTQTRADVLGNKKTPRHQKSPHYWAMTECGKDNVDISDTRFQVSNSVLNWDGVRLTIDIDELNTAFPAPKIIQAPFAKRLRGSVVVTPKACFTDAYPLDAAGQHQWRPIAPIADVTINMAYPEASWQGTAYVDSNQGSAPLESAFHTWDWSRTSAEPSHANAFTDSAIVIYNVQRKDGSTLNLAKKFSVGQASVDANALEKNTMSAIDITPPPVAKLPASGWAIHRNTVADPTPQAPPRVIKTIEDTPFYARSIVTTTIDNEQRTMFHESLSLSRFNARWVQMLLPFKMRRK